GPGETLGEMALLDGQPRSASIVALEPLRLLNINRESFHNWLGSVPAMGMSIMSALSRRLRAADNVRTVDSRVEQQLAGQVNRLMSEKEQLIELQRVREETSNLVVHDLRNPLSIIMGALSMLELVLPEEVLGANRELLDLMESSMERMQRLVDSLLDVARLESGELPLNVMACNLKPIIEEIGRRVQMQSQLREVTVCIEAPDNLPLVVVDVEKMDRVLANLMDNALKYTPSGGMVTLAAEAYNDAVVIRITDTGPGIPPADRERIFERFAQVKGDHVAHGRRGFGLGLTFCKLTIEAHGGQIWVEDGPDGVGSQFVFTLPLG
ncbi:MAG TPA: ATP-binding protein, partial [Aggregatilineaceae bacterium]|nr:ATP-binding protein [Aggregatilineaceae bacterium]